MRQKFWIVSIYAGLLLVSSVLTACAAADAPPKSTVQNDDSGTAQNNTLTTVERPLELPTNFQYPNGIAHTSDGVLYVGSITSGRILRISPNGSLETLFPGNSEVFAATSLRLDEPRGILWGTSPDFLGIRNSNGEVTRRPHRFFAIDTRSGELLRAVDRGDCLSTGLRMRSSWLGPDREL